jgi:serine/threonine protein kinase
MNNSNNKYRKVLESMNRKIFSDLTEFRIIKQIGQGGFSKVYLAEHQKSGNRFALKKLNLNKISEPDFNLLISELTIHSKLNHPNVVKLYDSVVENNDLFIIMEYCPDGNLFDFMRKNKLSKNQIKNIFKQILKGVEYIHNKDVIIRDLKPENIVKVGNVFKLCDFGWSVLLSNFEARTQKAGTLVYMSPESLQGHLQYTNSDIWSLGIFLYELHFNFEPFKGKSSSEMLSLIYNSNIYWDHSVISPDAVDLILKLLQINPSQRISLNQVINHEFLKSRINSTSDKTPARFTYQHSQKKTTVLNIFDFPQENFSPNRKMTHIPNSEKNVVSFNNFNFFSDKKEELYSNDYYIKKYNAFVNYPTKKKSEITSTHNDQNIVIRNYCY